MTNVTLNQLRVGSLVVVRPAFGTGQPIRVTVAEVEEDIKNGRPGIGYTFLALNEHGEDGGWAYLDQVVRVVTY
jgi:hypothetical protein